MRRRHFGQEYVTRAAHILGLLSHETRLNLVLALAQGPASVSELCDHLGLPSSHVSHHLGILRAAALVADEREGQYVIYRTHLPTWRALGDGFFDQLLGGLDRITLQHFRIERVSPPRA